jgi:hypothetical protein
MKREFEMGLSKKVCVLIIFSITLWGCGSGGGTGPDDGGDGDTDPEPDPIEYSLSVTTNPDEGGSVDSESGTYEEGTEVTVEATANDGWEFAGWSGGIESDENPLTVTIEEDTDLTALFSKVEPTEYDLIVSADPSEGGSVDPTGGTFEEGTEITVEATANEGFVFREWIGDVSSDDNPVTFTINEDTEMTAGFDDLRSVYTVQLFAISDQDTVKDLRFGQSNQGSDGFDDGVDQEAPPSPPEGALNTYFEINDLDLYRDFRSNLDQQVEWTMQYQVGSGEDLKIEWDFLDDTQIEGSLILSDESGNQIDMMDGATYTITGSTSGTLSIIYSLE